MKMNKEWYKKQIETYNQEYKIYEVYAKTLENIMNKACSIYAQNSIVQSRVKKTSSFAEKIIRKSYKYKNPIKEITDLCGVRIIVPTLSEIRAICNFIKAYLIVDEENSLDVSTRLRSNEFGYLSIHYIVTLPPQNDILGIELPKEIGDRKAEIQIRTALQHSWADISHKKIYKSPFNIAERFKREAARLAAIIENTDDSFEELTQSIDYFNNNYSIYMKEEDIENEIEILETIVNYELIDEEKITLIMRLVQYAKILKKWDVIIKNLTPIVASIHSFNPIIKSQILVELGYSLSQKHKHNITSGEYKKGQEYIKKVAFETFNDTNFISHKERKIYIDALLALAWTYKNSKKANLAKELYFKAYEKDSSDPYILLECTEYYDIEDLKHPIMQQTINRAIETCIKHINDGIELPKAYFEMGRLYYLLDDYGNCLASYLEALHFCSLRQVPQALINDIIHSEIKYYENNVNTNIQEHNWIYKVLLLGNTYLTNSFEALKKLKQFASKSSPFLCPIIIIAGGTSKKVSEYINNYKPMLERAFMGYKGTVISGGTDSGISGIIGDVVYELNSCESNSISLLGYIPSTYSNSTDIAKGYNELYCSTSVDFGLGEPIQYWVDLATQGILPSDMILLGINGGKISLFEYKLALALGAKVAVLEGSGRAATEILLDKSFNKNPNLICFPNDSMSLNALINGLKRMYQESSSLTNDQIERAAKVVHQNYIKNSNPIDPSMKPWECLDESLKLSNRNHILYCEEILKSCGYKIRATTGKICYPKFSQEELYKMAEMEHGRWVADRLLNGWKYGDTKDIKRKISPYLIPWNDLPDSIKKYDLNAVENYCNILATVGLEVYKKQTR